MMSSARILIVEDEGIEALDLQQRLESKGYHVLDIVSGGEEAVQKAEELSPDLILMDIMLQGHLDGIAAAEKILSLHNIPVIYITAYADEDTLQRAKITEPYGYIVKPFREKDLFIAVEMALYKHQMEKRLKESEKWFSTTLKSIGDAVVTTDQLGNITFLNPVAEKLLGWQLAEVRNKSLSEIFRIIDMYTRNPAEDPVAKVLLEGCTVGLSSHTLLIRSNGEEIPIDDSAAPIKDDKGRILGAVLVFRDVTERTKTESALRQSEEKYRLLSEKLQETNELKNEFLGTLSHELRNPLAAIHISLSVLDKAAPNCEQTKRAKEIIKRQVSQLSHLVDDLLDITRITRKKIRLKLERLELNDLVRQTVEDHQALFEKNGVQLLPEFCPTPLYLDADKARIVQVVGNLLHNAAKFTGCGGKTFIAVEADSTLEQAFIRVKDTGIGITPEVISRLFQPFMQADISLDRSRGGLGLGLALSKGLVELHGGTITARSDGAGKGSEFLICLPLTRNAIKNPPALAEKKSSHCRRILIIDDNIDMTEPLRELLELNGHKVAVAYNGPEGIAKARAFQPEILLCDIGLPQMNGYEVAKAFRSDKSLNGIYLVPSPVMLCPMTSSKPLRLVLTAICRNRWIWPSLSK